MPHIILKNETGTTRTKLDALDGAFDSAHEKYHETKDETKKAQIQAQIDQTLAIVQTFNAECDAAISALNLL